MLADLMVQAQAHQQRRQASAAAAAAASRAAQPPELQDAALSYRALLHVVPSPGDGGTGRSPSRRKRRSRASGGGGGSPAAAAAAAAAGPAGNHSMGASAAGGPLSLGGEGERSRRQAGRWNAEEVAALIEGVRSAKKGWLGQCWLELHYLRFALQHKGRPAWTRTGMVLRVVISVCKTSAALPAGANAWHALGGGL